MIGLRKQLRRPIFCTEAPMEQLPNGFTLTLEKGCFPLSTDSMVLAHFVNLPKNARVLDLGSGCGTLGLLLCARDAHCKVTGIELDTSAHLCARENILRNGVDSRIESICADLRQLPRQIAPGSFSLCISNPPYFSSGPASREMPLARREDFCDLQELMRSAAWALKYGGDFYLVHRPERLGDIIARAAEAGMEAKRLLLVRHRPESPISIIALQLRKGGKPGLKIQEDCLFSEADTPTAFYKSVYHLD